MTIIPCRQATFLISKRQDAPLLLSEKFDLVVHLLVCKFCRRFMQQTRFLTKVARHFSVDEGLTAEEKQKLQEFLRPI